MMSPLAWALARAIASRSRAAVGMNASLRVLTSTFQVAGLARSSSHSARGRNRSF
ncbi:MAG: hypothetical protein K2X82_30030 [Gemmataceae bacterium]|nr:hypothetical protein [Gemmataceae bacterium]